MVAQDTHIAHVKIAITDDCHFDGFALAGAFLIRAHGDAFALKGVVGSHHGVREIGIRRLCAEH